MGLIGAWLGSLYVGFPLVVMSPLAFLARPLRWLQAIHRWRGTLSAGPNFAYELCLKRIDDAALAALDLSSWRLAFNGAEAVSPDTVRRFAAALRRLRLAARGDGAGVRPGRSHGGAAVPAAGPRRADRRGPARAFHARAVAPCRPRPTMRPRCASSAAAGRCRATRSASSTTPAAKSGERIEGRLEFQGPSATRGYFRDPEQTARLFHDGWLDSGDRAYRADGDVYITGRVKDIVIRAGRNLYPEEIEEAVGRVDGVRKGCVAVFGSPDPATGTERLVVLAEVRTVNADARAMLREAVTRAVIEAIGEPPDEIVLAPPHTVLKTSSGKVRRSACRALYEAGGVGAAPATTRRQVLRLALGAAVPRLRHLGSTRGPRLFGVYAMVLFWLLAPPVWLLTLLMPSPAAAWALARGAARALFAPDRHDADGARAGAICRAVRACW